MSSKVKRKVTVENSGNNDGSDSSRRPSVFERLGPGAVTLNSQSQDRHARNAEPGEKCRNWLRTGNCAYGSNCRYQHDAYSGSGRPRKSEREMDEKDLRYKVRSKRKDAKEHKNNSSPSPKKSSRKHGESRSSRKSEHESKLGLKSTVVITRPRTPVSEGEEAPQQRVPGWEEDSDDWPLDASQLDYKEELTLEMKRQQLQKELELEMQKERMMNESVTITKPVSVTGSSSSSTSSRSTSSSTSSSSGSGTASSSSESSSSEESEGERSSSSSSRSSSSSSSFRNKGVSNKAPVLPPSKSPKKPQKEVRQSRPSSLRTARHRSEEKSKQPQPLPRESGRGVQGRESRSRKRRHKVGDPKAPTKGEVSAEDRMSGFKQRGPRTPSPATAPRHAKQQWHGGAVVEQQEDRQGRGKRRKRKRSQTTKEQEPPAKIRPSSATRGASPNHRSGGARRHRHRDDSSLENKEKYSSQKNAPKHRGLSPGLRKHHNKSPPPPPPPPSLPPRVAADSRDRGGGKSDYKRPDHFNTSAGNQSNTVGRPQKKSRKAHRAPSPKVSPPKQESHHSRDSSRDKQGGSFLPHPGDRRSGSGGAPPDRGGHQQSTLRDRRKDSPPPSSRDKENNNRNDVARRQQQEKGGGGRGGMLEENRMGGERGPPKKMDQRKEEERQRTNKGGNAQSSRERDQSVKRKSSRSPGPWEKDQITICFLPTDLQRPYDTVEPPPARYGDNKRPGDDRRLDRGRGEKMKMEPEKDMDGPPKRRGASDDRQKTHSSREMGRQSTPPRNQRLPVDSEKGDYSKGYGKSDPRREDASRGDQRGGYPDGRHREPEYALERPPPLGDYPPDPYRDYRDYQDAQRDHYAARRDYPPHLRRNDMEPDHYGAPYMRDEYLYPPQSSLPHDDWDAYRDYSANHEPLGPSIMMSHYRGGGRGEPERVVVDRYREVDTRGEPRLPPRDDDARSGDRRQRGRSPSDWPGRRGDDRREPSPIPPPRYSGRNVDPPSSSDANGCRPQSRSQEPPINWDRGSRHSSRGSAEGQRASHRKNQEESSSSSKTSSKRETSAPSGGSGSSSRREKEKISSKHKESKSVKRGEKESSSKPLPPPPAPAVEKSGTKEPSEEAVVVSKRHSRSKTPPPPPSSSSSSRSESRRESAREEKKKKSSSSGEKSERKKSSRATTEQKKKAPPPPPLPPPPPPPAPDPPLPEAEKEEGEIKAEPLSPAAEEEPAPPPPPPPRSPSPPPPPAQNPPSPPPPPPKEEIPDEQPLPPPDEDVDEDDLMDPPDIIPKEEILHISPSEKDGDVENFSDWSDDEDDELLTRDEPTEDKSSKAAEKEAKAAAPSPTLPPPPPPKPEAVAPPSQENRRERRDRSKERSSRHRSRSRSRDRRSKERTTRDDRLEKKETLPRIEESVVLTVKTETNDLKEEDIDYDPISDDELEAMIEEPDEVGKQEEDTPGFINSLGVDWASLACETLPRRASFEPGNARKRFGTAQVLRRVGISQAWAGPELTQRVVQLCDEQLKSDGEEGDPAAKKFVLEHPIAAFQVTALEQKKTRANILHNMGPYRKALCARQDLYIRRQLCKIGLKASDNLQYNQQQQHVDKDLYKLSIEMFRRSRSNQNATTLTVPCCS